MTVARAETSGVRIFPPAIYLAGLAAGFLLQWARPIRIVPASLSVELRWAGAVLIGTSLLLISWAFVTFRRAGTTPNPTRPTSALAFDGPYRFTRNPMYLSLVLMSLGAAFAANALWPLLALPPVVIAVRRLVIDREERYLEAKFGDGYARYRKRVRRWL